MEIIWIILIILVVLGIVFAMTYNSLVRLNERVNEAWSDITVQLKRRADLIPNLVESVKGYAKHEDAAINAVSEARSKIMNARSVASTAEADKTFTSALTNLLAVAEAYPDLKASENFKQLSAELSDTEDKIQAARRCYNNGAKELNTKVKTFPTNFINNIIGHFKVREYYEVDESEKAKIQSTPEVKF